MAPLRYSGSIDASFLRARSYLLSLDGATLLEEAVDATVAGRTLRATLPSLSAEGVRDEIELKFIADEPLIAFRVRSEQPLAMPPFCLRPGCINGNAGQRRRIEQLRDENGFSSQDESFASEKQWVPIFLH